MPDVNIGVDMKRKKKKKDRPLVSIITPMYNRLEYTIRCIDAVKRTNRDFSYEHILINNGSSDGTHEWFDSILNSSSDWWKKMFYLSLPENIGDHKAKAYGMDHAKGKYICMLDNDMALRAENFLRKMVDIYDLLSTDMDCGVLGAKRLGMRCVVDLEEEFGVAIGSEKYTAGPCWYVPMPFYSREVIPYKLINGWPRNLPEGRRVWKVLDLEMVHMDGGTQKVEGYNWGDQKHKYPGYFDSKVAVENEYGKDMISQWES